MVILNMKNQSELSPVKQKLLTETAKISWHELQRFFAAGSVLWVADQLDLLDVATYITEDQAATLKPLLANASVAPPSDAQALVWFETEAEFWSVVVAPFVVIQCVKPAGGK